MHLNPQPSPDLGPDRGPEPTRTTSGALGKVAIGFGIVSCAVLANQAIQGVTSPYEGMIVPKMTAKSSIPPTPSGELPVFRPFARTLFDFGLFTSSESHGFGGTFGAALGDMGTSSSVSTNK